MRFLFQLLGCAAAVFLLCVATAPAAADALPAATYGVDVSAFYCAGFNCGMPYSKQVISTSPTGLQVGCSADAGAPICAGALLNAAPAPFVSVGATTPLNHPNPSAGASISLDYYYQILCPTCAPGTIVPMSIGGSLEAHYNQGSGGTASFNALSRVFVNGYDPVLGKDTLVDLAMEGFGAIATDLTKTPNPLSDAAPNGFGFCESVWNGFFTCNGGPGSPFGTRFQARVNTPYLIELDALASVASTNALNFASSAETTIDPVISFAPGFDSTGYTIDESPGIGNVASTVPEPATWPILLAAALGWGCSRMLRRLVKFR